MRVHLCQQACVYRDRAGRQDSIDPTARTKSRDAIRCLPGLYLRPVNPVGYLRRREHGAAVEAPRDRALDQQRAVMTREPVNRG